MYKILLVSVLLPFCLIVASKAFSFEPQLGDSVEFRDSTGSEGDRPNYGVFGKRKAEPFSNETDGDVGTASRFFFRADWELETADPFFYCEKASRFERETGLPGELPCVKCGKTDSLTHEDKDGKAVPCIRNDHPAVKPIKLTRHLASLLLPPKEYAPRRIFVPFSGVGSEVIGAILAGWEEVVGVDSDAGYCAIAEPRIDFWSKKARETGTQGKLL